MFTRLARRAQWERRHQEEELSLLREQTERVSQAVEEEIRRLEERDRVIRTIRHEQQQARDGAK